MWVVWTAASCDCFPTGLAQPILLLMLCYTIWQFSSTYCTVLFMCHCVCSLHMHSVYCRLSNNIVLHSVQLCFHYHCGMCSSMHAGMDQGGG